MSNNIEILTDQVIVNNDYNIEVLTTETAVKTDIAVGAYIEPTSYVLTSEGVYTGRLSGSYPQWLVDYVNNSVSTDNTVLDIIDRLIVAENGIFSLDSSLLTVQGGLLTVENALSPIEDRLLAAENGISTNIISIEDTDLILNALEDTVASHYAENAAGIYNLELAVVTKQDSATLAIDVQTSLFGGNVQAYIEDITATYASANLAYATDHQTLAAALNNTQVSLTDTRAVIVSQFDEWDEINDPILGQYKLDTGVWYQYLGNNLGDNFDGWVKTSGAIAQQGLTWAAGASSLITAPDGSITGWAYADGSGINSEFAIYADNFRISDGVTGYTPFSIVDGVVYVGGDASTPMRNIGNFATEPDVLLYPINSIYRNTTNGNSYIKTQAGVWELFLEASVGVYTATLYMQTDTPPVGPFTGGIYNFSTGLLTDTPIGWSLTQPASSTIPTYAISYTFTSSTPSVNVTAGTWTTPIVISQNGISISGVTNYYLASASASGVTTATTGWTTTVQTSTANLPYLWNYEEITYSSGTLTNTEPAIIGKFSIDGKGISSIVEYYAVSSSNSVAPTSWFTTLQITTTSLPYLWNYERITYTDATTSDSTKRIIGTHGATGLTGNSANIVFKATSTTTAPTISGTAAIPTGWSDGIGQTYSTVSSTTPYLWYAKGTSIANVWTWGSPALNTATNIAELTLYKLNDTTISTAGTYNFATGVLSGQETGWTTAVPGLLANGDKVYITNSIVTGAKDSIVIPVWSTPTVYAQRTDGVDGADGLDGTSATVYELVASSYISNNLLVGTFDPTTITFSILVTVGSNLPTTYTLGRYKITRNGVVGTITNASSSYVYTIPAGTTTLSVEAFLSDGVTSVDKTTIVITQQAADGTSPISAILSNPYVLIPTDSAGNNQIYTSSGTQLRVYEGSTELTCASATIDAATTAGQWVLDLTPVGSFITPDATPSDSGTYITMDAASNMTADTATITYTVQGKKLDGTVFSGRTAVQSFVKNKQGLTGVAGASSDLVFQRAVTPSSVSYTTNPPTGWVTEFGDIKYKYGTLSTDIINTIVTMTITSLASGTPTSGNMSLNSGTSSAVTTIKTFPTTKTVLDSIGKNEYVVLYQSATVYGIYKITNITYDTTGIYTLSVTLIESLGTFTTISSSFGIYKAAPVWSSLGTLNTVTNQWTWGTPGEIIKADSSFDSVAAEITAYQRATSSVTPVGGTFNFDTGITVYPTGWYESAPVGTSPVWMSKGIAVGRGMTSITWKASTQIVQDGVDGATGIRGTASLNYDIAPPIGFEYSSDLVITATTPMTKYRISGSSTWTTATATTMSAWITEIYASLGLGSPIKNDKISVNLYRSNTTTAVTNKSFVYSGTEWLYNLALVVNGDAIVDGTLSADKLTANTITADKLDVNALSTSKFYCSDANAEGYTTFRNYTTTTASTIAVGGISNDTNGNNTGVFGKAEGASTTTAIKYRGVHGTSTYGVGVYGVNGNSAVGNAGVIGKSTHVSGVGVYGEGGSIGVVGTGSTHGFWTGTNASIGGTVYPFTGAHKVLIESIPTIGDIVGTSSAIGLSINNTVPYTYISTVPYSKTVFGVFNGNISDLIEEALLSTELGEDILDIDGNIIGRKIKDSYVDQVNALYLSHKYIGVNSLGEGMMNVCDINGTISAGDYICSSNVAGKGMKQDDDILHSYTVAKALQDIIWTDEVVGINGCYEQDGCKCKMIACTYHCG